MPLQDVVEQMRRNIRVQAVPTSRDGPIVLHISFAYPDQAKSQATVRELAGRFAAGTIMMNRHQVRMYQDFWHDESLMNHTGPAPPAPTGESVDVLDPGKLSTESAGPSRIAFMAWGLGAGLVLGLLAALGIRRPHGLWQLCGYSAAGCIFAVAISLLVPARYPSTGVMRISPAVLMEDPLATPPAVTPAAEFLQQIEPQVLSFENLSMIVKDYRLNLYPEERSKQSMEEVIRNMLARDLRIHVLNTEGAKGAPTAFSISFSYYDQHKAQQVVQTLITNFWTTELQRHVAVHRK